MWRHNTSKYNKGEKNSSSLTTLEPTPSWENLCTLSTPGIPGVGENRKAVGTTESVKASLLPSAKTEQNLSTDHPRGLVQLLERQLKGQKSEGRRDEETEPRPRPRERPTLVAAVRTLKARLNFRDRPERAEKRNRLERAEKRHLDYRNQ